MKKGEHSERTRRALAEPKVHGAVPEAQQPAVAANQAKADAFAREMRPIFAELEAQGIVTCYALARTLSKRKVPTARGGVWTGMQVKLLLKRIAGFDNG
jgi:hypothetical protein